MLIDAGPLVALLDKNDQHHTACVTFARRLSNQAIMTTWLCFTEAIYFLGEEGGYHYQERLWKLRRNGVLTLLELTKEEGDLMDTLMATYQNVPMDAADASLVAVAQTRRLRRIFTVDSDFYIYRLPNDTVLDVIQ